MMRVLICDPLSPAALQIFKERGIAAETKTGLSKDDLVKIAGDYDGLVVRSATKIGAGVIKAAHRLKVIGRAGIGVDTIDVAAATTKGVVVMNTPFGNLITTAEHAIALMFALAREIPAANASTHAGKWEKNRFMGMELAGKTLGLIGCGNIGSIVADRAKGLKMKVIAYDPYLSPERAASLGVEKAELDDLLTRADIVSLHAPLTEKTRNIVSREAIAKMKRGARLINCARGGLVDEAALREAIESGRLAGAAFDVFEKEPAKESALFGCERIVATPHLGASTTEAQETVALQIAEQISDYLLTGAVTNAINMPSITAEQAAKMKPWIALAERLGAFLGQLAETSMKSVEIVFEGSAAKLNVKALTQAALAGLLKPALSDVNMVNAPVVARDRGIEVSEISRDRQLVYEGTLTLSVTSERQTRSVAGTVFPDGSARVIRVKDIDMEAQFARHMLYVTNDDKPGFIGALGTLLGKAGVNIASFNLGRTKAGGDAIALLEVDGPVEANVLAQISTLSLVKQAQVLEF